MLHDRIRCLYQPNLNKHCSSQQHVCDGEAQTDDFLGNFAVHNLGHISNAMTPSISETEVAWDHYNVGVEGGPIRQRWAIHQPLPECSSIWQLEWFAKTPMANEILMNIIEEFLQRAVLCLTLYSVSMNTSACSGYHVKAQDWHWFYMLFTDRSGDLFYLCFWLLSPSTGAGVCHSRNNCFYLLGGFTRISLPFELYTRLISDFLSVFVWQENRSKISNK